MIRKKKSVQLVNDELDILIQSILSVYMNRIERYDDQFSDLDTFLLFDRLNISILENLDSLRGNTWAGITVDTRNHPTAHSLTALPFKEINGKTFLEVYKLEEWDIITEDMDFNLYYTKNEGLVGIVRKDGTFSLNFERKE